MRLNGGAGCSGGVIGVACVGVDVLIDVSEIFFVLLQK